MFNSQINDVKHLTVMIHRMVARWFCVFGQICNVLDMSL